MADSLAGKKGRKMFRFFNRDSTNKNRLTFVMGSFNFVGNCFPFIWFIKINFVVFIFSGNRKICWNWNYIKAVNLIEFNSFCCSSTSHSGKFVIHTEEILESNCCHCAVTLCNADVLFCFNCLMKPIWIAASFKNTACKLINNFYFSITNKIIYIVVEKKVSAQSLGKVVCVFKVLFIFKGTCNQIMLMENVIDVEHTFVSERNTLWFFINCVISFNGCTLFRSHKAFVRIVSGFWIFSYFLEFSNIFINFMIFISVIFTGTWNNKRCTGFINQDRVNFVDNTEIETSLNLIF